MPSYHVVSHAHGLVDVFRKILHVEQKELRVVLAHLRAISFDTVDAVSKWRVSCEEGTAVAVNSFY